MTGATLWINCVVGGRVRPFDPGEFSLDQLAAFVPLAELVARSLLRFNDVLHLGQISV